MVSADVIKLTVTNNAVAVVEDALSLTGNHGLTRANPLERHYRDVLCGRVHPAQDDATRAGAGRLALGI
jgi:alkylation response protein AidB-like acyl-CoA dehydrogenase